MAKDTAIAKLETRNTELTNTNQALRLQAEQKVQRALRLQAEQSKLDSATIIDALKQNELIAKQ